MESKNYQEMYDESIHHPIHFWNRQANKLHWFKFPSNTLHQDESGLFRWFADGSMNTCYLALDDHIQKGRGNQTALIYDSPVTKTIKQYTYKDLRNTVAKLAGGMQSLGVTKGDTVIIYMPMIPQAVMAMLACARLGAVHSVVFGGFAPHELAIRIDDAKPKLVISASYGIEFDKVLPYKPLLDAALLEAKHKPNNCLIYQRHAIMGVALPEMKPKFDIDFEELIFESQAVDCVPVLGSDPLYVLYTSGTTGKPKGIVRDNGGHAVAMKFSMETIYNVKPGEVFWAASDVGWVVGHSYIVYGPLIHGCTTLLYEGKPIKTPDAGAFWRVAETHHVNVMFTAPTAIRAIKKEDADGKLFSDYSLKHLRQLFLAGERCDPATYHWIQNLLQKPVIDHWWQTESGWPMLAIMTGIDLDQPKSGSAGKPVCGFHIDILNEEGKVLGAGEEGFVAIKLPLPPGCLPTLWNNDEGFKSTYLSAFDGYYVSGDGGLKDTNNYFSIMGRIDDVINVSGHRLSTGEMEEILSSHLAVAECAVIGISDELRGQRPIGLVVLKDTFQNSKEEEMEQELCDLVRDKIGAISYFKTALIVKRLPKTRSGKILRKVMRQLADRMPLNIPSTIDDPLIIEEIKEAFLKREIIF
ncbi:MAG: AMP-binding protein [Bacteroidia bacterium]|jgi:acyl-coenzyme A synthetase/AMP-(fatty) acid ligase|nr:AMP-binding protein [Bacteroidia bacterium]